MTKMGERTLILNIISATHFKKVKTLGHQTSYVVAYIYPDQKHTSKVDETGGLSPSWNFEVTLKCDEHLLHHHGSYLTIEIYSHGHTSEKPVGNVVVPLRDLAKDPACYVEPQVMIFEVRRPFGKVEGLLNLSVKISAIEKRSLVMPNDKHPYWVEPTFVCTRVNQLASRMCNCEACR